MSSSLWPLTSTGISNPAPILAGTKPFSIDHFKEWTIPLNPEELSDIHSSITEIEKGKSHRFKNLKDALEWLHGD